MKKTITILILITVVLYLLYNAIKWEANDIRKIYNRQPVYLIKDKKEKEKEYIFYSTFNSENNVVWRSLFICSVISSLLIYFFFKNYTSYQSTDKDSLEINCFIILFIVFLVYYLMSTFKNFHMYRVMTGKILKNKFVFENAKKP